MLRVSIYSGKGANFQRLNSTLCSLGFEVSLVDEVELSRLPQSRAQVLYLPGGWYHFGEETNRCINAFVNEGGGCVGSCAGAYLVAGELGLIPGRVLRPNIRGRVYLEPQRSGHPILEGVVQSCTRHDERIHGEPIAVTHLGGPFLLPDDKSMIVASYDFEGQIGAIIAAQIGQGRAVAIASHPELALAELPHEDTIDRTAHEESNLPQGNAIRIIGNAVLWAAQRESIAC